MCQWLIPQNSDEIKLKIIRMIQRNRYVPEGMYVFSSHLVAQRSSCLWLVDDELTNRNKGTWKKWNSIRSGDWFKDDRSKDSPRAGMKHKVVGG